MNHPNHPAHTEVRCLRTKRSPLAFALAALLFAGVVPDAAAYYDVTIGTTSTAGAWSGYDWIPSGTGSTVSASEIQGKLASGPVTIGTGSSGDGGGEAGDITVSSALGWDTNTLTLTAADTINVNAVMSAGGTAGLALNTGTLPFPVIGSTPLNFARPVGKVKMGMGGGGFRGRVDFTGSGNTMTINGWSATIITTLGAQGSTTNTDLQGLDSQGAMYVLGADIDASATAGWNGGAGFKPLPAQTTWWGNSMIDGLGHTISGLTINRPGTTRVGLIGVSVGGNLVRNLRMLNVDIVGGDTTGAVVGGNALSMDMISDVYVTGRVAGANMVGGLAGYSWDAAVIRNSAFNGNVSGTTAVGGLMGMAGPRSWIDSSFATGSVHVSNIRAGGLLGSGTPDGFGFNYKISDSYFSGSITGGSDYGLPTIGGVFGTTYIGEFFYIDNTYATGTISVGTSSPDAAGGIAADLTLVMPTNNFHDIQFLDGLVDINSIELKVGITALPTAQMQQQASFTGWDFNNTWRIYEGHTYPLLRSLEGLIDSDSDGHYNNEDAFPVDPAEWLDTDGDGIGNNADTDDDGDTISDVDELANGTDPLLADTDGDGVNDNLDAYPLDPTRSAVPSSSSGGGCTLNPQAGFDPMLLGLLGAALLYLRRRQRQEGQWDKAARWDETI